MRGLLIGEEERAAIDGLRQLAARQPVEITGLVRRLAREDGKTQHMRQMTAQTIDLPIGYCVTFSVELGHPCGAARHLSVSLPDAPDRLPHPVAVWEIAQLFGFWGSIEECAVWAEKLRQGDAVNLVQPIEAPAGGRPQ